MPLFHSKDHSSEPGSSALRPVSGRPPRRTWRQEVLGLYGLVGVILLALWGLVIGFSAFQKQSLVEDAQRELGYLRSAVAQHTEGLFHTVETDLRVIDRWLQDRSGIDPLRDPGFNSLVDEMRKASAGLIDPRMVSTRGQLHYLPARDGRPLADVSDRPYYREALKLDAGQLYIGDPVLSRVTGKWGIPVSMRLTRPVGGMQVVFAAVELDRLQAFHEQFRVKPSGAVAVLRRDGIFMSRTPFEPRLIGRNFSDQPWFALMRQGPRGATITDGALTNNPPRLQNFEQLQRYPLIVSVSRNVDDVLDSYYERRDLILVVVAVITVLGLFFAWRLHRTQHDLHQSVAMLMAAGDASPLGQFRTDAQGRLVMVNEAWRRIHGMTEDRRAQDWRATTRLESSSMESPASQGYLPQGEHALRTADGRPLLLKVRRADIVVDGVVLGCSGTVEDVTEQRANQKAQRMLTEVFELSTDLVVQSDMNGNCLYANPAFRRFIGCAPDASLASLSALDILGEEQFSRREREVLPVALRQGYWQGETLARNAQGEARVLSHLLIAHRSPDGSVQHFSGILRDITASKTAERQLHESEQRLRAITDSVPALIAEIGTDYVYRFANRAYEEWLGIARGDMLGRSVEQVMGRQLFELIGPYHARAFRGERVDYVREARHAGQTRWLHVTLVPRLDEDGRPDGCYAIGVDITENRKVEAALRENEQRLRAITDNVPALIAEIGADLRFRFVNRRYEQWMGLDKQGLINHRFEEVYPEDVTRVVMPRLQAALRGEVVEYERQISEVPGGRVLQFHLVPRRDEQTGAVLGFYTLGTDITAARQAEIALHQNERLLISITDRMPMRVSYVDHEQCYRFVNLAYEKAFARPRQAWYGRTVREMLGEAGYQKAEPYILRTLQGEAVSFDGELTTAEGYRSYRSDYVPQFAEDGHSVLGFVCIITDTTGQKLEERRLIALSQRDPLTGLLNRSGFDSRLRDALQHAQATQSYLAVMYLDIDRFKQVNDKLGHLMGDLLLQGFSGRLSKILRATDTVVRLGGDEFAILLEEIDSPLSAVRVADNIVQAMQEPFILEDRSVAVTTSIGVAVQAGSAPVAPRELMRRADEQLYAAKGLGRNRYSMEQGEAA